MTSSDALFQLIKSLSKGEKRYFRLAAARYSGEKKYLLLFDEIDRCGDYNEEAIRERVAPQADPKQFHVIKNYLFDLLLKRLRSHDEPSSIRARLRSLLANVEILYNRGIFKQAARLWKQGEKMAEELDDPRMMMEVIELRYRLSGKGGRKRESLDDIYAARMETLREMELRTNYLYLRDKLGDICTGSPLLNTEQLHELDRIVCNPLLTSSPVHGSRTVRKLYLQTLAIYHYGKQNDRAAFNCMMETRRLFDDNRAWRAHYFSEYLVLFGHMLHLTMRMEEYDLCEELLRDLAALSPSEMLSDTISSNRARGIYLENLYSGRLLLHTTTGEFQACVALAPEIEEAFRGMATYRQRGHREDHLFLLAYAHFGLGDYDRALELVNKILNKGEPQKGRSIYYGARMLELLLHYELGNHDLLESLERSLRNRLLSQNLLGEYEAGVLRFFREALSDACATNGAAKKRLFDCDRYEATQEVVVFPHIDFAAWIEAKKKGISLSECVRRRLRQEGTKREEATSIS